MVSSSGAPLGRYAIRITDPANPNVTIGYVFATEESFIKVAGADAVAQDAIAELEARFAKGPVLEAVRFPLDEHSELRTAAKPGSADRQ